MEELSLLAGDLERCRLRLFSSSGVGVFAPEIVFLAVSLTAAAPLAFLFERGLLCRLDLWWGSGVVCKPLANRR